MRIAIFTDTYLPEVNGAAKTLGRWVDFLREQGMECMLFTPGHFRGVPLPFYPECRIAIPNPRTVKEQLDRFRPTFIHVASPFGIGLLGRRYALSHGIPWAASYHTHFDRYLAHYHLHWSEPLLWKYLRWFHRDCRKVFVPSPSTASHLQQRGFERLSLWGRGVDTSCFTPMVDRGEVCRRWGLNADKFTILYAGRLASEKRIDLVLAAYESLPPTIRQNSQLVLAGGGPLYSQCKQACIQSSEQGHSSIHMTGYVNSSELQQLYAAADVLLFPSDTETFGNVVLEAMACGTPVIGADAGGVRDIVRHEKTGLLTRPGDLQGFVSALIRLYSLPDHRLQLARNGRAYAAGQSWQHLLSRLLDECLLLSGEAPAPKREALKREAAPGGPIMCAATGHALPDEVENPSGMPSGF